MKNKNFEIFSKPTNKRTKLIYDLVSILTTTIEEFSKTEKAREIETKELIPILRDGVIGFLANIIKGSADMIHPKQIRLFLKDCEEMFNFYIDQIKKSKMN